MPVLGTKIFKLDDHEWQVVTPAEALTMKCPESLLGELVQAFGKLTPDALADKLGAVFEREVVLGFVNAMRERGIIYLGEPDTAAPAPDSLFHLLPIARGERSGGAFQAADLRLNILGSGRLHAELMRMAREAGYQVSNSEAQSDVPPSLILVASDTPNHTLFRDLNRSQVIASGVAAIFSYLDGATARIFKVIPGATACFECLHHRMRVGKTFYREFDAASSGSTLWFQETPAAPALQAQQLAATTLIQASAMLGRTALDLHEGNLVEIAALSDARKKTAILKLPRCEVCGPGNTARPFPPIYNPAAA